MNELRIEIKDQCTAFAPGEEISGTVYWSFDSAPRGVELRLFWFTRGKGTEDAGVAQTTRFEQPLPSETRSFRFLLPEAPYSFSGTLISLVWALELIASPSKETTRCEFVMAPDRREVRLEKVPDEGMAQGWLRMRT
jgi:hypothetical protein